MEALDTFFSPYPLAAYRQGRLTGRLVVGSRSIRDISSSHFLVSETTQAPIGIFLAFLTEKGSGWSPTTTETYADSLKDFADFLDASRISVREITVDHLRSYKASFIERPSPVTGRPYSFETVSRLVGIAQGFSIWASKKGLLDEALPLEQRDVRVPVSRNEFAHTGRSFQRTSVDGADLEVDLDDDDAQVEILEPEHVDQLMTALGGLPQPWRKCEPATATGLVLGRLVSELALVTGLRRIEICRVSVRSIAAIRVDHSDPLRSVSLKVKRKGGSVKKFLVPMWMVYCLQQYAATERAAAVASAKRTVAGYIEPLELFVNGMRSRRNRGRRINPKWINSFFSAAQVRIGMLALEPRNSVPSGRVGALYRFHDLRHTYAVWTYIARREAGDSEPWYFLCAQLGHKDVSTTIRIYATPARVLEATASMDFYIKLREIRFLHG